MTKKQRKERNRIITALVIYVILAAGEHILRRMGLLTGVFSSHWVLMIPYLLPYFIAGGDVVKNALIGIKNLQMLDESFLMFIATIGAFVVGENSEACAVMLFYQVGEFFQDYAVNKSRGSIKDLMEIAPESANLLHEDGTVETIDPDDVEIGNILVIRPGEKVPVDGVVVDGSSMVDTAALTGESVPRSVRKDDEILSGCINGEGLLKIRASKEYEDSTVSRILEMVEEATSKKSRTEDFITRFARWYTPLVVLGAVILAVIPSIITRDPLTWIYRACTFLVISCPCALVISVPLSFFGGIGAASREGVLVKGSNYLELMAELDTVVSDKTGTLTKGEFTVTKTSPASGVTEQELLETAAFAEGLSTHPIAASIRRAAGKSGNPAGLESVDNVSGRGLIAKSGGRSIIVGNAKMMQEHGISCSEERDDAATIVYVAENGKYLGAIAISDVVKPEAAEAIHEMKEEGVRQVVMLTGDRKQVGEAIGSRLGIDHTYSELLPDGKVQKVEELLNEERENKKKLAFLGDGINDAPVLARADVGIAMGSLGSDAAIEAADVVIMDDNLDRIPLVIRIARRTVRIARENIVFAIAVKLIILLLGALGLAGMWAAVFADVGVAIICIINSMRMLNRKAFQMKSLPESGEMKLKKEAA
ncbi:MAG: cadmium-translocating P-type ATPase [Eubacterium sp.]|nr:cadmium-translocating P-type ATPase [Eubacterium sp.]MCH4046432.1 cadmium-translocating P-type ATPase [Eubacterium sp.]MCH4079527.1 cadmium-translocating P-type ATPase [Eubacterium sp.]MCH4111055.1 cadmium-translocating P-type ATPase [Eubacterium sp.]MCI1307389.1 cadmium-translocating P-type ATPase [Eubacterium sp.]